MNHAAAAEYLLRARAAGPGPCLPAALLPGTEADAYAIQRLCMARLGPIGGWKVGAAGPDAPPSCAPMPASGMRDSPARLASADFTTRDIESEIAFRIGRDLPPRDLPYTNAEIVGAIASCHPGIEVLQSRFTDGDAAPPLANLADLIRHGAYIIGAAIANWQAIDFAGVAVVQTIHGDVLTRVGNPAGDMIRLVTWLADSGAVWAGGLRAGQLVTCGSWTGKTPSPAWARVTAAFAGAPVVELAFT